MAAGRRRRSAAGVLLVLVLVLAVLVMVVPVLLVLLARRARAWRADARGQRARQVGIGLKEASVEFAVLLRVWFRDVGVLPKD